MLTAQQDKTIVVLTDTFGATMRNGQWEQAADIALILHDFCAARWDVQMARQHMDEAVERASDFLRVVGEPVTVEPPPAVAALPRPASEGARTLDQIDAQARARKLAREAATPAE